MADVTETRQLYDPQLAGSRSAYLKSLDKLGAGLASQLQNYKGLDTSKFAPQIAAQDQLQKTAVADAAGLKSLVGPDAYKDFMSPYQQEVMDTTLSEFDRQQAIQQTGLRDQALAAGAYGGGREGVQQAQFMNQGAMDRATLQAQLLNQGFQQAQQAAGTDLAARQGLGQYQQALGQADQGFAQAGLDANTLAQRESLYEPFTRLGLVGQQLAAINPGAFGSTTVGYQSGAAPASPMSSFLGGGAGAGGVLGKLGIFG